MGTVIVCMLGIPLAGGQAGSEQMPRPIPPQRRPGGRIRRCSRPLVRNAG